MVKFGPLLRIWVTEDRQVCAFRPTGKSEGRHDDRSTTKLDKIKGPYLDPLNNCRSWNSGMICLSLLASLRIQPHLPTGLQVNYVL